MALAAEVRDNHEPGGGKVVRFVDPAGLRVDVVWGKAWDSEWPARPAYDARRRPDVAVCPSVGMSTVSRVARVAVHVTELDQATDFYQRVLGFRVAGVTPAGERGNAGAVVLRCGRAPAGTTYGSFELIAGNAGRARLDRTSFDVQGGDGHVVDDIRLLKCDQVFDRLCDPFGNKIERWAAGESEPSR